MDLIGQWVLLKCWVNWTHNFFNKIGKFNNNEFLNNLREKNIKKFYDERQKYTNVKALGKIKKSVIKVDKNDLEIYRFKDFNIVEFNTKANALDYNSMDALMNATDKPLVIINESMQFSAGVNLNYVMEFIKKKISNQLKNLSNISRDL